MIAAGVTADERAELKDPRNLAPAARPSYTPFMLTYTITDKDNCRQAGSLLRTLLPDAPLSYLRKLLASEHLSVNGKPASRETLLRAGDRVTLKESARTKGFLAARPALLDILHEDQWLIAINKPAGLAMHRTSEAGEPNLVDLGGNLIAERGEQGKLRPVNRLDRGTSGVVLLARSSQSAGMLGRLVKEEGLGKIYLALANEAFPADEGTIEHPLDDKESETHYKVMYQGGGGALVALWPMTGRMHQIRRHLSFIGHPVWGDSRYGGRAVPDCEGQLLHSFRTTLDHPATGEILDIFAPLPVEFLKQIKRIAGDNYGSLLDSLAALAPIQGDRPVSG